MKIKKKNRITAAFLAVGLSVTTLSAQLPVSAAEDTEDGTEDLFSDTEQIDYDDADTDSDTVYDETPVDDTGSDTDYEDQDTGADAQITDTSGTAEAVETQDTAVPDVAADAGSSSNSQSTISTTVPDSHNIRVEKSHADVVIEGEEDQIEGNIDNFVVDRFAEPKIRITPEEGWKVSRILLNGEDVTEQFQDGYLTLEEVCEDTTLVIETAEDTSGGESKDPDKDKDPGKNPDKDKDPNKGTPGTGKGHESEKKTPLNKLKNQMAAVTGDEARPMLYVLAAIAAAAVISVTVIRRKNK